jgi:atrial natriuretic peptide receptor A
MSWLYVTIFVTMLFAGISLTYTSKTEVKLGVILPEDEQYPFSLKRVMPAIDYAIDNLSKMKLLPGCVLKLEIKDSRCSETFGPLAAVDLHVYKHVHVYFGPVCDYAIAPVARFSPEWNIPVLSAGAPVSAFDNKTAYKLLTRVHGAHSNAADFFLDIARKFHWSHWGLIYNEKENMKSECFFRMEPIFAKLNKKFKLEGYPWYKHFDENKVESADFEKMLRAAELHTRSKLSFMYIVCFYMCPINISFSEMKIPGFKFNLKTIRINISYHSS